MQQARSHFTLSVLGNTLIAIGGRSSKTIRNTSEILKIDGKQKSWRFITPLKTARHSHAATSYGDTIYISGGVSNKGVPLNDIQCIRPLEKNGGVWLSLQDMPRPRCSHSMMATNSGKLIVIGGTNEDLISYKESIVTENKNSKESLNDGKGNSRMTSSSAVIDCYVPVADYWYQLPNKDSDAVKV